MATAQDSNYAVAEGSPEVSAQPTCFWRKKEITIFSQLYVFLCAFVCFFYLYFCFLRSCVECQVSHEGDLTQSHKQGGDSIFLHRRMHGTKKEQFTQETHITTTIGNGCGAKVIKV